MKQFFVVVVFCFLNNILPDDLKSDCGPAEKVERFSKSVFKDYRCEPLTQHIVTCPSSTIQNDRECTVVTLTYIVSGCSHVRTAKCLNRK